MSAQNMYKGKKILILGNSTSTIDIINIAKKYGAKTIAVDYSNNQELIKNADEYYCISTADLEALEQLAIKEKVDGVMAGVSEFNIEQAILLSERIHTPFYATHEQWRILSNKELFKNLCQRYGIPVVDEYEINNDFLNQNIKYPVIIKPVDSSGGRGISVCNDLNDLKEGYKKALECSKSKKVVLEKYMTGEEVVIYYTLQDGYISLSAMCDRYTVKQMGVAHLPSAYIFPSKYLKNYMEYDDGNVKRMFKGLGMKNGLLFMQAFIDEGRVRFYEMGYRIAGPQVQNIISAVNGVDALEMLVHHSLSGKMKGWDLEKDDTPLFEKYACILSPILKPGKIKNIVGLDKVSEIDGVTRIVAVNNVGDIVGSVGTLRQLLTRIYLVADTIEELKNKIDQIQKTLKVFDENDDSMLLDSFDTTIL